MGVLGVLEKGGLILDLAIFVYSHKQMAWSLGNQWPTDLSQWGGGSRHVTLGYSS